ncbi:MAG: hypothetical protein KGY54_00780 [Oleiphilaceae bacterium]|nr:hypothetical protein [Oleiphilaceae bacterium]
MEYALSDLIMFTPEVYLRLFIRFNEAVWPVQLLALAAGVAIPVLLTRQSMMARKLAVALLSLAWIACGFGFMGNFYAPINWPVAYFGYAFAGQALLIAAVAGAWQPPVRWSPVGQRGKALIALWLLMLLVLPWLTVAAASDGRALPFFALTPDLTVLGSILATTLVPRAVRWLLLLIPIVWCGFSALTLLALGLPFPIIVPLAGLLAAAVAFFLPDA